MWTRQRPSRATRFPPRPEPLAAVGGCACGDTSARVADQRHRISGAGPIVMPSRREQAEILGTVIARGASHGLYQFGKRRGGPQKRVPYYLIWTPTVVSVDTVLQGALNRRTILVWELGGEVTTECGDLLRLEVCRARPQLTLGRQYLMNVESSRSFEAVAPGFKAHSIQEHTGASVLTAGQVGIPSIPGPSGFALVGGTCGHMVYNARWPYDPASMSWDVSLLADFGQSLSDSYFAAAAHWSAHQADAPQAADHSGEPIDFSAAVWDPDQFVDIDVTKWEGVSAATLALQWVDPDFTASNDVFGGVWSKIYKDQWLETCLGVIAPRFHFARVAFNTNFVWDDPNDTENSPNAEGVWVHEIGHFLGLPHRTDCPYPTVMAPGGTIPGTWDQLNWIPQDDDDYRIRLLYPREVPFPVGTRQCP